MKKLRDPDPEFRPHCPDCNARMEPGDWCTHCSLPKMLKKMAIYLLGVPIVGLGLSQLGGGIVIIGQSSMLAVLGAAIAVISFGAGLPYSLFNGIALVAHLARKVKNS